MCFKNDKVEHARKRVAELKSQRSKYPGFSRFEKRYESKYSYQEAREWKPVVRIDMI